MGERSCLADLIKDYSVSLRRFKKSKVKLHKSEIISDTEWIIEYMRTGYIPGTKWTVARWETVKREVPFDPHIMDKLFMKTSQRDATATELQLIELFLQTLSERERDIFEMYYRQGFSHEEMANLLGISKRATQEHLTRAREKVDSIREKLKIVLQSCSTKAN